MVNLRAGTRGKTGAPGEDCSGHAKEETEDQAYGVSRA